MTVLTDYQQITQNIGGDINGLLPEILKILANEKEAKVILSASPPATIHELAEKTGFDENEVQEMVDALFLKGLIFKSKKPDALRYYALRHVMQMHDATILTRNPPQGMMELWKKFMEKEWGDWCKMMESIVPNSLGRIIPINRSLDNKTQILAADDIDTILDNAKNIAVTNCSCRVLDGACGHELEVCLQLDKAADYALERGTGRKLTKEEAKNMMKRCGEAGLVPCGENSQSRGHVICNCCGDCCMNWASFGEVPGQTKLYAPSRFAAAIDAENCSACETCLDRCFFEAIAMDEDVAVVDMKKCMGCGVCKVACPDGAITMKEVRGKEFIPQ